MKPSQSKPPRRANLSWERAKTLAKAGLHTKSAIGKKIAQKARTRLKRSNNGMVPKADEATQARLRSLEVERASRQRHHLIKLIVQAAKKARTFLVRRQLRKSQEAAKALEAGGTTEEQQQRESERLRVLKAVAPSAVARRAVRKLGLSEEVPADDDDEDEAMPPELAALRAQVCAYRQRPTREAQDRSARRLHTAAARRRGCAPYAALAVPPPLSLAVPPFISLPSAASRACAASRA